MAGLGPWGELQGLRAPHDSGAGLGHPVMLVWGLATPCSLDLPSHPSQWLLCGKYYSFPGEKLELGGCRLGRPGYQPLVLGCCGDVRPGRGVCSLCPQRVGSRAGSLPGGKGRKLLWEMGSSLAAWL